jgi:hypothetical protein
MDKKKWYQHTSSKVVLTIGPLLFIIFMIGAALSTDKAATQTTPVAEATVKEPELSLLDKTKNILTAAKDHQVRDHHESVQSITMDLGIIGGMVLTYLEAKESKDAEVLKVAKELKIKLTDIQVKGFPKLRKEYARIMKEALWEHNITVKLSGNKNTKLMFTSALFADNANIKMAEDKIHSMLTTLRFKRANYEWYEGSGGSYYDITSAADNEIIAIE